MTDPTPETTPRGDSPEVAAVFRRALRDMVVLVAGVAVLGVGVGWLVAGVPGVWGALVGAAIALVFSGTTTLSMLRTSHTAPGKMMAVIMGTWLGKLAVVVVVLAVLRGMDFYDRYVLAVVVAVAVIGSALLDYRAVQRGRVPYVSPSGSGPKVPNRDEPDGDSPTMG
ncbi:MULTISPECIES: hypothetical protein [unclassified Cellulomonas]|uniref:hypothetical protein n=1 Tax=unclassified Cellulomonas TaxID=2620175 RepID=UPI0019838EEF|nr:hypothetical protein [Cellulomonas sp. ES6]MBD3777883.1 hypothetical protein [Micrococcales bacterium]WHP18564.1 hypothetical protein P9841_05310 [Cellulomonas sp. ES6]